MRRHTLTVIAVVVLAVVVGLAVGVWNLVDTREPVAPVQLQPSP